MYGFGVAFNNVVITWTAILNFYFAFTSTFV